MDNVPMAVVGVEEAVRTLLRYIGEDPEREGLKETPARVMRAYDELLCGYRQDPKDLLKTFRDGACNEMVVVKNIEFSSFCEHHWLEVRGVAHICYLPKGRVIGLSKLGRVVDIYAKRLQMQERMTTQITEALMKHLKPKGAGCMIEATHACMSCRGVKKERASTVTSCMLGAFQKDPTTRAEFLSIVRSEK